MAKNHFTRSNGEEQTPRLPVTKRTEFCGSKERGAARLFAVNAGVPLKEAASHLGCVLDVCEKMANVVAMNQADFGDHVAMGLEYLLEMAHGLCGAIEEGMPQSWAEVENG
jgi:hypothetical protein